MRMSEFDKLKSCMAKKAGIWLNTDSKTSIMCRSL